MLRFLSGFTKLLDKGVLAPGDFSRLQKPSKTALLCSQYMARLGFHTKAKLLVLLANARGDATKAQ